MSALILVGPSLQQRVSWIPEALALTAVITVALIFLARRLGADFSGTDYLKALGATLTLVALSSLFLAGEGYLKPGMWWRAPFLTAVWVGGLLLLFAVPITAIIGIMAIIRKFSKGRDFVMPNCPHCGHPFNFSGSRERLHSAEADPKIRAAYYDIIVRCENCGQRLDDTPKWAALERQLEELQQEAGARS